jgi:hypothetical protein
MHLCQQRSSFIQDNMRSPFFLLGLIAVLVLPTAHSHAAPRCFPEAAPEIVHCIDGRLKSFWEQQGGLPVFGYPLSAAAGAPVAQEFERTRLELHPTNPAPYDVLLGRLGAEHLARQGIDWTTLPKADPATPRFFPETGHAIAREFWPFWSNHGLEFDGKPGVSPAEALALFGFPLTEPRMERSPTDGKTYLTQWFERARFEHHPEHAGTPYEVLLGLLGREVASSESNTPAPAATAPLQRGGFVEVSGSRLTRLGRPIQLKGVNYYPMGRPWRAMYDAWDPRQIERELRLGRDQLGINTVRVLLPYETQYPQERTGIVSTLQLQHLREMAQIAGDLDLRLIVTLFDFHDNFPAPGTAEEREHFAYLRSLLGNFVGDDRIIAWDLHNEPDHYDTWKNGNADRVLTWLGRMADEVHRIAPNHLVTVGMGFYENLLRAGPDGRRPIDYSDMVSVHNYNRRDMARQFDVLRAATPKPLVLEEFGWPTGITCLNRDYQEAEQLQVYTDMLAAATGRAAGVVAWTLRDFHAGPTVRWDTREEYYGLYRPDDTLKPAARVFQAYPAEPLPAAFRTSLPLTVPGPNPTAGNTGSLLIAESGYHVKGLFRRAWDLLGGHASLGAPLSEAFVLPGDVPERNRVIQYFEAGALQLRPNAVREPGFATLPTIVQIQRQVVPLDVGVGHASSRGIPAGGEREIADVFQSFYRAIHGQWRLGEPITDAFVEDLGGVSTTVQYFRNGRLQLNPTTGVVEAGNVGRSAWAARCAAAP